MASGTIAATFGIPWHQELLERNEIAGDPRPNRSAADGLFRKTWPSQPDNWEMKPQSRLQVGKRQLSDWALHKKSWAVIDRPYSLGCATVGALYERPRCIFCAKPSGCSYNR